MTENRLNGKLYFGKFFIPFFHFVTTCFFFKSEIIENNINNIFCLVIALITLIHTLITPTNNQFELIIKYGTLFLCFIALILYYLLTFHNNIIRKHCLLFIKVIFICSLLKEISGIANNLSSNRAVIVKEDNFTRNYLNY